MMRHSEVTLPPLVEGPARGALVVSFGAVSWQPGAPARLRQHKGQLLARITWWGDNSGGELLQLPAAAGSSASAAAPHAQPPPQTSVLFPLRTGPKYITRYLRDMGALTISLELAAANAGTFGGAAAGSKAGTPGTAVRPAAAAAVASVAVGLQSLDVAAPISCSHPVVLPAPPGAGPAAGTIIGSLPVHLQLDYSSGAGGAVFSSFELNEYLASRGTAAAAGAGVTGAGNGMAAAIAAGVGSQPDAPPPPADQAQAVMPGLSTPLVCCQLETAMQDRDVLLATLQQVVASRQAGELSVPPAGQEELAELPLGEEDVRLLVMQLLPDLSPQQLEYAVAMLLPFGQHSDGSSTGGDSLQQLQLPGMALCEVEEAAAACADVERRLQQQPPAAAVRGLRQLVSALGGRSLDLTAAFAAANGRLSYSEVGILLQRLLPSSTEEQARCLLAILAGAKDGTHSEGGSNADSRGDGVTLSALKAAIFTVLDAQQFPTAEDVERQQAAAAERQAKEEAAVREKRTTANATAAGGTTIGAVRKQQQDGKKAAVFSKLKDSLQRRRSGSFIGVEVSQEELPAGEGAEAPASADPAAAEPHLSQPPQVPQAPLVALGIPVLQPPPPVILPSLSASQQLQLPATAPPAVAAGGFVAQGSPAVPAALAPGPAAAAAAAAAASPAVTVAALSPPFPGLLQPESQPAAQQAQQDPLLQLIQQAEQLKAAMQQAGSGSRSRLAPLVSAAAAAGPHLPNLLLPPPVIPSTAAGNSSSVPLTEAAADGSLSAATTALVAAAKALRLDGEQQQQLPQKHACSKAADLPSQPGLGLFGHAAPAAVAPPAGDTSDPESDAEDALLESLFYKQAQQQQREASSAGEAAAPAKGLPAKHRQQAGHAAAQAAGQPGAVLRVHLQSLRLAGKGDSSVRCVVKPLCRGGEAQQLTLPVGAASACLVEVPLQQPAAAAAGAASWGAAGQQSLAPPCSAPLLLPPYLFLEFWQHNGSLLGMTKVPLVQPSCWTAAAPAAAAGSAASSPSKKDQRQQPRQQAPALQPAVVAEGRQPIADILEGGTEAGSIHVAAVVQGPGSQPLVPALRHCFTVAIHGAYRLPVAAAYAGVGLRAPDGRFLRYSFPGEPEALQTKQVVCCSNPSFEASANHELILPAAHSILPLLRDGLLRFELYDSWEDRGQQQHGWALLQLTELATLVAEAEQSGDGGSSAGGRNANRVLLLPLCTEYDSVGEAAAVGAFAGMAAAGAALGRGPALKVEVSYCCHLCTMGPAEAAQAAAAVATAVAKESCAAASASEPVVVNPPGRPASAAMAAAVVARCGGISSSDSDSSSDSEVENSRRRANRNRSSSISPLRPQQPQHGASPTPRRAGDTATPSTAAGPASRPAQRRAPASPAASSAAPAAAASPAHTEPAEPYVTATLSVEIIQACGLTAAVREAAAAMPSSAATSPGNSSSGGSSGSGGMLASSLSRAAVVGPHAFARLVLFAEDEDLQELAPPLLTSFVPQSFSPAWKAAHTYRLHITAGMLHALASQRARVEVWHRCMRAMSTAKPGSSSGDGQREVLLGAGSMHLVDVLRKPQGLKCWVPLVPPGGPTSSNVGAVQIAVRLTELGGVAAGGTSPSSGGQEQALLLRCAEAAELLAPPLQRQLLLPPGAGFQGQPALAAVYLDLLLPLTGSSSSSSRPKADRYYCCYSLPSGRHSGSNSSASGSKNAVTTAARVLTAVGGGAGLPHTASSRKVAGAGSKQVAPQQWAAKLNHSGFFEVTAGTALVDALLQQPLLVHVYKQPAGSSGSGGGAASARSAVFVGSAEVDLSALLWSSSSSSGGVTGVDQEEEEEEERIISGSYPLLEGVAASQGGASLAARVHLQLLPVAPAARQAAAAAAVGADAASGVWELAGEPQQRQQRRGNHEPGRGAAAAGWHSSSSSSEHEGESETGAPQRQHHRRRSSSKQQRLRWQEDGAAPTGDSDDAPLPPEGSKRLAGAADRRRERGHAVDGGEQQPGHEQHQQQAVQSDHGGSGSSGGCDSGAQRLAAGAAGPKRGAPEGAPTTQQQAQQHEPGPAAGKLLLQIDTALHLPAAASGSSSYRAYVQAVWGPNRQHQQRTAAVPVHYVEVGGVGGTAVWNTELELPATASAWLPSSTQAGTANRPMLLLNVWNTCAAGDSGSSGSRPSSAAAASMDAVIGCAVVDLSQLPQLGQQQGWWPLVDSAAAVQQGQVKVAVKPDATLLRHFQEQQQQAVAVGGSSDVDMPAAVVPADAGRQQQQAQQQAQPLQQQELMEQLQAQLQELELLSRRLAAAPAGAAGLATATTPAPAAGGSMADQQQLQRAAAAAAAARATSPTRQQQHTYYQELNPEGAASPEPRSDDEGMAPFDARQRGYAWSGSDSDDDAMALVGVAFEGAVSPGFSDEEAEVERQSRPPRQPAMLLQQDWMFDIAKPATGSQQAGPGGGAGAEEEEEGPEGMVGADVEQPAPRVSFRNVIPQPRPISDSAPATGAVPPQLAAAAGQLAQAAAALAAAAATGGTSQPGTQQEPQQAVRRHTGSVAATPASVPRAPAVASDAGHLLAAGQGQAKQLASVQPSSPTRMPSSPTRVPASPTGVSVQAGWQFDFSKPARQLAAATPAIAGQYGSPAVPGQYGSIGGGRPQGPSPPGMGQFAPMQSQQQAGSEPQPGLAQQRQQLMEHTQRLSRTPGGGGIAATIDQVLEGLLGSRAAAAMGSGAGAATDASGSSAAIASPQLQRFLQLLPPPAAATPETARGRGGSPTAGVATPASLSSTFGGSETAGRPSASPSPFP